MIEHCVFLNLKQNIELNDVAEVMIKLSKLVNQIEGFQDFTFGQNLDFENKSADFDYGFVATFENRKALQRYANDPRHMALGAQLVDMCTNGHDDILVFDLSV